MDGGNDDARGGPGAGDEGVAEAELPALGDGAADEDWLEEGLGEVDVGAGARGVVVALGWLARGGVDGVWGSTFRLGSLPQEYMRAYSCPAMVWHQRE